MGFPSDDRFSEMDSEEDTVIPDFVKKRRLWLGVVYALTFIAGFCALLDPSQLIVEQISSPVSVIFALAIIAGAGGCLFSSITDFWIGEFSAIPLLSSALSLYGTAAMFSAYDDERDAGLILVGYGLFMVAFSILLAMRWFDVRLIKVNAAQGEKLKR